MQTTDNTTSQDALQQTVVDKEKAAEQSLVLEDNQSDVLEPKKPNRSLFRHVLEGVDKQLKSAFTVVVDGVHISIDRKPQSIKVGKNRVTIDY